MASDLSRLVEIALACRLPENSLSQHKNSYVVKLPPCKAGIKITHALLKEKSKYYRNVAFLIVFFNLAQDSESTIFYENTDKQNIPLGQIQNIYISINTVL